MVFMPSSPRSFLEPGYDLCAVVIDFVRPIWVVSREKFVGVRSHHLER
jgi:hypothetical protein